MHQRLGLASTLAIGAALLLAPGVSAQMAMSPHPAHIHAGSCPEPGDVVAALSDVSFEMNVDGSASAGAAPVGQASAIPVEVSVTSVPLALADIVAGPHAINVHASADDLGTYIACGDIGGTTVGASDLPVGLGLPIGLAELNDSGASGAAWLQDGGDGTTTVYVLLVPPAGAMSASPAAATEEAIAIKDFAYAPVSLDIGIGSSVTWTNEDSTQHTATAGDGSFDSGVLAQGDTFSQTFDTAGTFDYICTLHPSMKATVTVS